MKIKGDELAVDIVATYFIKATDLEMFNVDTLEYKKYSEIEDSDIDNWIVADTSQLIRESYDGQLEELEISEAY